MASEMKEMEEGQDIQTLSPGQFKKILQEEIELAFKTALQTAIKTAFENFWGENEGSDESEEKPSLPQLEEGEGSQDTEILFTEGTENQSEQEFIIIKDPAESNLQGETITTVCQHLPTNKLNRCSKWRKGGNLKTRGTSRKNLRKTTKHNRAKKRQKVIRKIYFTRKMETKKPLKVDAHLYKELRHLNMVLAKRKLQKIKKRVLNCDLNIGFWYLNVIGSRWLIKEELEEMLVEKLSDQDYLRCIKLLERLVTSPCCGIETDYVLKFRKQLPVQSEKHVIEPLKYDERGVAFSTGEGRRKTARATVTLYDRGSGKITINGYNYVFFFSVLQDREQLMFPFQFVDRLGKHDMVCSVSESGRSAQAGAIRLATARALCSFVTEDEVERMRQAGLLTVDPRVRERKKPGQEGARRKFTWKKR
ncbi:UNVERIFIED_CONTAM: hypothetical protein K2H54_039771 [Gekko kuhli]